MPTSYLDTDDFDALVGGRTRLVLFDDSAAEDGTGYSSTLFDRAAQLASIRARAAMENAGYSPGDSTTEDGVTIVALAALISFAFGRKGLSVPEATQTILADLLEGVRVGDVPIPNLSPSSADGVGGIKSTDRSTTSTTGRPPIFKDLYKVR